MLSDESSSDSETGRFKGRSKKDDEHSKGKQDHSRQIGRGRHSNNDRFRKEFDRSKDDRDHLRRHSRDQHRYSRHSPVRRSPVRRSSARRSPIRRHSPTSKRPIEKRRNSPDRSHSRKSHERHKHDRGSRETSRQRDYTSNSTDKRRDSKLVPHDYKRDLHQTIEVPVTHTKSRENSLSPEGRSKRSEVYRPPPSVPSRQKSDSPIIVEEHDSDKSEEVQLGSYYNLIPAVVKEKPEDSSEIDSSDDERLRARLLNLEKELQKTKKKKHKKKHKRKCSKSSKDRETTEDTTAVEVSSTTDDIQDKAKSDASTGHLELTEEVTSTQKNTQKESCEEGEISSDDSQIEIDPTDLRHKLRRSAKKNVGEKVGDVCGPALPPHLTKRSPSPATEGPALPPHLQKKSHIGPAIPDDMRRILAEKEREVIRYESSDEDLGIGPIPAGDEEKWSDAHRRLEERALEIKIKKIDKHSSDSQPKSREQWMLELPEGKAKYLGLEARSFRPKEGPDMSDRSSWTDTPEEKARKAAGIVKEEDADEAMQRDARARQIYNRDDEQETAVKKHKKKHKRDESLLDMHQKKLKKKKKKEEKEDGQKERRPFSRDVDLQVNRFDDAQKKSIIKKAQDLNCRFSRGEAKYL